MNLKQTITNRKENRLKFIEYPTNAKILLSNEYNSLKETEYIRQEEAVLKSDKRINLNFLKFRLSECKCNLSL